MKTRSLVFASTLLFLAACQGPSSHASMALKPYPLDDCLVTDNQLGSMGDPVSIEYQGQEIKFCCEPCEDEFRADPDQFLAKLPR